MTREISQIQPFNEYRFDDCMAFLSMKQDRALTTYELLKLHVMIDIYHTVDRGVPVIGGVLWPFTNGPVSRSARSRVKHWTNRYAKRGQNPDGFLVVEDRERYAFKATRTLSDEEFSGSELKAMQRAWSDVVVRLDEKGFRGSQSFFHEESFIGRAWDVARSRGRSLDWDVILTEYERENEMDCSTVKGLLTF